MATGAGLLPSMTFAEAGKPQSTSQPALPKFPSNDPRWQRTWEAAIAALAGNIHTMPRYPHPVLVEGSVYPGIWQECAPQEGLVYGTLSRYITPATEDAAPLKVARNNHMAFFALQRPDGQLPASVKLADSLKKSGRLWPDSDGGADRGDGVGAFAAHRRR